MAYSDPNGVNNPTSGQPIPAAWGDIVRDDLEWLARNMPHASVYNNAAFSVPNSTVTAITFNSERIDVGGMHSTSANTSRLTVPTGGDGWYEIGGCLEYASNATGARYGGIRLNGTTILAYAGPFGGSASYVTIVNPHRMYQLVAGDYVELVALQDSGGALNVQATGNYSPEFWAAWRCV